VARGERSATVEPGDKTISTHRFFLEEDRVTQSRLCYGWSIKQLAEGYRYCFDDVICAHLALEAAPRAERLLDLGSGLGTIGLLWLGQQPRPLQPGALTMLEAQAGSVALCRDTLQQCGLSDVVDLRHGDLRDEETLASLGSGFDVVTANPPYLPMATGSSLPRHPQRAYCRHEMRGGTLEFCTAAMAKLEPGAPLCLIHASRREADVLDALEECKLSIQRRVDVLARGKRKSIAFVCDTNPPGSNVQVEVLEVQDMEGRWTAQWLDLCHGLGL